MIRFQFPTITIPPRAELIRGAYKATSQIRGYGPQIGIAAAAIAYPIINAKLHAHIKSQYFDRDYKDKDRITQLIKFSLISLGMSLVGLAIVKLVSSIYHATILGYPGFLALSLCERLIKSESSAPSHTEGQTSEEQALQLINEMMGEVGGMNLSTAAIKPVNMLFSRPRMDILDEIALPLSQRENVCLVGPPGVGKTQAIEDLLVQLYHNDKVDPDYRRMAQDYIFYKISPSEIDSNTSFHGQFSTKFSKLKTAADLCEKAGKQLVLYIDEVHMLSSLGASATTKDSSATHHFKPLIEYSSDPRIILISATTDADYQKFMKDSAFTDRLGVIVNVEPPSDEVFIDALHANQKKFYAMCAMRSLIPELRKRANATIIERRMSRLEQAKPPLSDDQLKKIAHGVKSMPGSLGLMRKGGQVLRDVLGKYFKPNRRFLIDTESEVQKTLDKIIEETLEKFTGVANKLSRVQLLQKATDIPK